MHLLVYTLQQEEEHMTNIEKSDKRRAGCDQYDKYNRFDQESDQSDRFGQDSHQSNKSDCFTAAWSFKTWTQSPNA